MASLSSRLAPQPVLTHWRDHACSEILQDYVKWPLLLLAASGIFVAGVHFGGGPLMNYVAGKTDYFVAKWEFDCGHDKAALTSIRAALTHSRTDASIWEMAAAISAREEPEATAYCWQQADLIEPGVPTTQLGLARAAWQSHQYDLAAAALAEVDESRQAGEQFLLLAAQLAEARGDDAAARDSFEKLTRLRSIRPSTLLAVASYRTRSGNTAETREGIKDLVKLLGHPELQGEVERELIEALWRMGDRIQALAWSDRLERFGAATWSDRVHRLDLLAGKDREAWLDSLQSEARVPTQIVGLADWFLAHGCAERALICIREQPEEMQADAEVAGARARCLMALGLWAHLRDIQEADTWPGHEHARLMYLTEARLHLGDENGARSAWARAVFCCQSYGDFLMLRERSERGMANPGTFWSEAQTLVLDHMVAAYPGGEALVRALLRDAQARRNSVRVEDCWQRLAALNPGDISAASHWNQLSLLRGERTAQASASMALLRRDHPDNADVLTASAFSFYCEGRFREAAETLGELSNDQMERPERAVTVGSILAVTGPGQRAVCYLAVAGKRVDLLPEERALVLKSQTFLDYRARIHGVLHSSAPARPVGRIDVESAQDGASPLFAVAESVELARKGDMGIATKILAEVDVRKLGPVERLPYLGGLLFVEGKKAQARSYLEFDPDLPEETALQLDHRALEAWWAMQEKGTDGSAARQGLFAVYQHLEETETDDGFWQRDASRELALLRATLLRGEDVEAVSRRLIALMGHSSFNAVSQEVEALEAFRRGQLQSARRCLEELSKQDLRRPEAALYYGVVLKACGAQAEARRYLDLARAAKLAPEDQAFAAETSAFL